jgi:hypothetical protein
MSTNIFETFVLFGIDMRVWFPIYRRGFAPIEGRRFGLGLRISPEGILLEDFFSSRGAANAQGPIGDS